MHEKEFLLRKATGWALREYGKTAPDCVAESLVEHGDNLSRLSGREGARRLDRAAYPSL